jgi:heme exporter protein A
LVEPDEGEVRWPGGRPLYVAHANALKDDLTVAESLRFLARLSSLAPEPDDASIDAALERVGLLRSRDAMARTLSQGQRRRAALARLAMPSVARVWLLDEPFDALDQASIGTLNGLLLEHLRGGGAIVLTSHQALGADAPACREFWLHERALSEAKS